MMKRLLVFLVFVIAVSAASQSFATSVVKDSPTKSNDDVAIYTVVWSGEFTTTYTASPYLGLSATYVDGMGITRNTSLTFTKGSEVYVSPFCPVNAGVYTVTARPFVAGDSLDAATATVTLTMGPEMLYLAPQMATMAGEEVLVSIARTQERLPLDGSDE